MSTDIKNCDIFTNKNGTSISAMCTYFDGSLATGFQMIAQINELGKLHHRLLIRQSSNRLAPVTMEVEENMTYLITIFPIRGERGIVDSILAYSTEISVDHKYTQSMHIDSY